jgi:hypothetical protein
LKLFSLDAIGAKDILCSPLPYAVGVELISFWNLFPLEDVF